MRVAALQNLVKIMSLYYQYMETYMGPALFAVRPQTNTLPHHTFVFSSSLKFYIIETCMLTCRVEFGGSRSDVNLMISSNSFISRQFQRAR